MCTENKTTKQSGEAGNDLDTAARCGEWPLALRLWRTVPAHDFDSVRRAAVAECMLLTSSTIDIWRRAVGGDAASAMGLALRTEIPSEVTVRTDLVMTVLLHNALRGSGGAALVLSHLLRRMPIDGVLRQRLATSWLTHNLRLASSELGRVRVRRAARAGGEDAK